MFWLLLLGFLTTTTTIGAIGYVPDSYVQPADVGAAHPPGILEYSIAYAESAETWISDIPTVFTDSGPGDCLARYIDSAYTIHPSILYSPEGFFGTAYTRLMAYTPFPDADADNENIHIAWSNDDYHWTHILDSTTNVGVINPIHKASDFGCIHASDPDLYIDSHGHVRVIFRLNYTDSVVLKDSYTVDGLNWSEATTILVDSIGDTLHTARAYNVTGHLMSPSVLYIDGIYHMWLVNKYDICANQPTWDTCAVMHLLSDHPDGGWSVKDSLCRGIFAYDHALYSIYHLEVTRRQKELLAWAVCKNKVSGTDDKIIMGFSYDDGSTWKMIDTTGSARSILHADSVGWDSLSLYRASGYWVDDPDKINFRMFYTGRRITTCSPDVIDAWHIGVTDVRFLLPGDANGDGVVNIGDAVFLVSYIFAFGTEPSRLEAGDVNGDCSVNVGDAVYLISYIFKFGSPPQIGCK